MIVHKVIRGHELERHTLDGWELKRTLIAKHAEKLSCSTPIPCHKDVNYQGYQYTSREEVGQFEEMQFLVTKNSECLSREDQLLNESNTWREKVAALDLKSKNDDRDLAQLREVEAAAQTRLREVSQNCLDDRTRLRKLEGDLAKVRTAIGTKAYDEALK